MAKHVRDTSALAHRDLQPSLSHREQIVIDALRSWRGPAPTSYELTQALMEQHLAFDVNSTRPRLNSLLHKQIVETGEKRRCRVTGRVAYTWGLAQPRAPNREPEAQRLQF